MFFHFRESGGQAPDDALVGGLVNVFVRVAGDDQTKVEDEFVAVVAWAGDGHGEAEDRIFAVGVVDSDEAVAKCFAGDDVFLEDIEIEKGGLVEASDGDDAAWWALGYNLGALEYLLERV